MVVGSDAIELAGTALEVAPALLNSVLVREWPGGSESRVRIIETEAYREGDPASHSFNGETPRSSVMFGQPGQWYVYRCYGIHWMLNLVCGQQGSGEAVLIRAVEPLSGLEKMEKRREMEGIKLSNGPGKLAEALGVDDSFNGASATTEAGSELYLEAGKKAEVVYESPRVGINVATERLWRFYLENEYLSQVSQNEAGRRRD